MRLLPALLLTIPVMFHSFLITSQPSELIYAECYASILLPIKELISDNG